MQFKLRLKQVSSRQLHHQTTESNLKTLMAGCHALGKLKLKIVRLRVRKAMTALRKLVPYVDKFLVAKRTHYANICTFVVESSLTQGMFVRITLSWKQKVWFT